MWRPIKTIRLLKSGLVYRCIVILVNAIFFKLVVKQAMISFGAMGASLIWGTINMCLYYLYHYTFLRLFKMDEREKCQCKKENK